MFLILRTSISREFDRMVKKTTSAQSCKILFTTKKCSLSAFRHSVQNKIIKSLTSRRVANIFCTTHHTNNNQASKQSRAVDFSFRNFFRVLQVEYESRGDQSSRQIENKNSSNFSPGTFIVNMYFSQSKFPDVICHKLRLVGVNCPWLDWLLVVFVKEDCI